MWLLQCERCAQRLPYREGLRFCTGCGHPIAAPCGACGQQALPGDRHCGFCGQARLAAAPGSASPAETAVTAATPEAQEFARLAEAARARALAASGVPAPPTKAHLDQDDIDSLFA